jgi:FkbM family methyltransferase
MPTTNCTSLALWLSLAHTSKCPNEAWQDALAAVAPPGPVRVVNVGSNKGYAVQSTLLRWAMPGLTGVRWRKALLGIAADMHSGNLKYIANGACRDGNARTHGATVREDVHVHALELVEINRRVLKAAAQATDAMRFLTIHAAAASNVSGTIYVSNLTRAGEETVSIGSCSDARGCREPVPVGVLTLDELFTQNSLTRVDSLVIDTEGSDALVLEGAATALAAHAVRVIQFEYHGVGYWSKQAPPADARTLRGTVRWLDALGYDCFFETNPHKRMSARAPLKTPHAAGPVKGWRSASLVPLTGGCWHDAHEIHKWSNVACVVRGGWERAAVEPFLLLDLEVSDQ